MLFVETNERHRMKIFFCLYRQCDVSPGNRISALYKIPRTGPAERPPWCTETKEVNSLSAFQHALGIRSGTIRVPSKA